MKISKKVLSLFVAFVIIMSTMAVASVSVSADSNFPALDTTKANITIGTVSVTAAGKVTVPVKVANNPGMWGANLQIAYNSGLVFSSAEKPTSSVFTGTLMSSVSSNVVTVYIDNSTFTNTTANGVMFNLVFNLNSATNGASYPISFTYVDRKSIINCNAEDISDLTFGNGSVTVKALATPAKPTISSLVLTKKNVAKLTWKKSTNATKYEVYRKVGSGSYSKVATTNLLYFSNTGLAAGKKYTYYVKPYNTTKAGSVSAAKTITTLSTAKPTKPALKAGKKSFTATRKTTTVGATSYQIQYSLKSSFKSAKTKTISKSVAIKSLKAKKYYYVRIRAIQKISGSTVVGTWSAANKVKTK